MSLVLRGRILQHARLKWQSGNLHVYRGLMRSGIAWNQHHWLAWGA